MKRTKKQRACDGKVRHDNPDSAHLHLNKLIANGSTPYRMEVYKCRHCSGWHVGHKRRHTGPI